MTGLVSRFFDFDFSPSLILVTLMAPALLAPLLFSKYLLLAFLVLSWRVSLGQQLALVPAAVTRVPDSSGAAVGMDFDVDMPIVVHELGTFLGGESSISTHIVEVGIFDRSTGHLVAGAAVNVSSATASRMVSGVALSLLGAPVLLPAGEYCVVAAGYTSHSIVPAVSADGRDASDAFGSDWCPEAAAEGDIRTYEALALRFVGTGRRSEPASGEISRLHYPTTIDSGPAARYAAGTFSYTSSRCPPSWGVVSQGSFPSHALSEAAEQNSALFPSDGTITDSVSVSSNVVILRNTISASIAVDVPAMKGDESTWFVAIIDCVFEERSSLTISGFAETAPDSLPRLAIVLRGSQLKDAAITITGAFPPGTTILIENNTFSMTGQHESDVSMSAVTLAGTQLVKSSSISLAQNAFVLASADSRDIAAVVLRGAVSVGPVIVAQNSSIQILRNSFDLQQLGRGTLSGLQLAFGKSSTDFFLVNSGSAVAVLYNVFRFVTGTEVPTGASCGVCVASGKVRFSLQSFLAVDSNTFDAARVDSRWSFHVIYSFSAAIEQWNSSHLVVSRNSVLARATLAESATHEFLRIMSADFEPSTEIPNSKVVISGNAWSGSASKFIGYVQHAVVLCNTYHGQQIAMHSPIPSVATWIQWLCPGCAYTETLDCSLAPLVLGIFTGFNALGGDAQVLDVMYSIFDGVAAAAHAINLNGGVHGRQLTLDLCESGWWGVNAAKCMESWSRRSVRFVFGSVSDEEVAAVTKVAPALNMFIINPINAKRSQDREYSKHWAYLKPPADNSVSSLFVKIVRELHVKRIAVAHHTTYAAEDLKFTVSAIRSLGVNLTGIIGLGTETKASFFAGAEYKQWVAGRPQAVLVLSTPNSIFFQLLINLLSSSARNSGVDPDVKIFTPDIMLPVTDLVIQFCSNVFPAYSLDNRFYFAASGPFSDDTSFDAVIAANREVGILYGSPTYAQRRGISYMSISMAAWTSIKTLAAMLTALPSNNLTVDALMSNVFNWNIYTVVDLRFGVFAPPCRDDVKANPLLQRGELIACGCNQGYNTIDVYRLSRKGGVSGYSREASRITVPLSSCGLDPSSIITPPLIYLDAVFSPPRAIDEVHDSLFGGYHAWVATRLLTDTNPPQLETLRRNRTNASDARLALTRVIEDRILSLALCPSEVVQLGPSVAEELTMPLVTPALAAALELPFVDPYSSAAQLHESRFTAEWLVLSATLQQELHALCSYAFEVLQRPLHAIIRSAEADAIANVLTRSANTFGGIPTSIMNLPGNAELSFTGRADQSLFVIGAQELDASLIVAYLLRNPSEIVFLAFSELCAMYTRLVQLNLTSRVAKRLVFATSMPNWNAPNLASNRASQLMEAFFQSNATSRPEIPRHPLQLRGFIASAAVAQVTSHMTDAFTPKNFLRSW